MEEVGAGESLHNPGTRCAGLPQAVLEPCYPTLGALALKDAVSDVLVQANQPERRRRRRTVDSCPVSLAASSGCLR